VQGGATVLPLIWGLVRPPLALQRVGGSLVSAAAGLEPLRKGRRLGEGSAAASLIASCAWATPPRKTGFAN
jgi:hypothetical protein